MVDFPLPLRPVSHTVAPLHPVNRTLSDGLISESLHTIFSDFGAGFDGPLAVVCAEVFQNDKSITTDCTVAAYRHRPSKAQKLLCRFESCASRRDDNFPYVWYTRPNFR